jgi:hypothetical protein
MDVVGGSPHVDGSKLIDNATDSLRELLQGRFGDRLVERLQTLRMVAG